MSSFTSSLRADAMAPHADKEKERAKNQKEKSGVWAEALTLPEECNKDQSVPAKIDRANEAANRLEDLEWGVRMNAVQVLSKLEPQLLALFAEPLVARLEDATLSVRGASRCALGLLAPEVLALHGDAIIRCCSSEHAGVRVDAMSTLALLEPVVLRQGARRKALLCGLEDSDKDVRVAAVKAVARLQTLVYFGHGDQHTSCTELPSTVLVSDVGEDKQQTVSDGTGSGATWRQTVGAPKKREPAQQRPPLPQVQASRSEGPAEDYPFHLYE